MPGASRNNRFIHARTPKGAEEIQTSSVSIFGHCRFETASFDFVFRDQACAILAPKAGAARGTRVQPWWSRTGLVFGSVTSDMAPALNRSLRDPLARGSRSSAPGGKWSELFLRQGRVRSLSIAPPATCTDAFMGPRRSPAKQGARGHWYADLPDSLRYSFFDKVEADDE